MIRRALVPALVGVLLGSVVSSQQPPSPAALKNPAAPTPESLAAGKRAYDTSCAACHGKDGNTPIDPSYPKLGGQHRDYLERALLDYREDRRKNAIMGGQAKALSRADIANLAAYYAQLPGQLSTHR